MHGLRGGWGGGDSKGMGREGPPEDPPDPAVLAYEKKPADTDTYEGPGVRSRWGEVGGRRTQWVLPSRPWSITWLLHTKKARTREGVGS